MSRVYRTQSVQYFAHSFTTCQVLNTIASYEYQKMNAFSNETCLNVKHQHFIFQHIIQIYLNTYWHTPIRPDHMRDVTAAIVASVVKTTHGLGHHLYFLVHEQTSFSKHVLLVL